MVDFLIEIDKLIQKLPWKFKVSRIVEINLKKKKVEDLYHSKAYYKAIVVMKVCHWHQDKQINGIRQNEVKNHRYTVS